MDKKDRDIYDVICLALIIIIGPLLVLDLLFRVGFSLDPTNIALDLINDAVLFTRSNFILTKSIYTAGLVGIGLIHNNAERITSKTYIFINTVVFVISCFLFIAVGFTSYLYYNIILYPIFFFTLTFTAFQSLRSVSVTIKEEDNELDKIFSADDSLTNFIVPTEKGKLAIEKPIMGMYAEGSAGSGKSVFATWVIFQSIYKGFAAYLYDFEGDYREGGALLSKHAYTACVRAEEQRKSILKSKGNIGPQVKFAMLNFTDLERTVKCNPFDPKYIRDNLELKEMINILMKSLEPEWVKKTDFWANNAINYVEGCALMLKKLSTREKDPMKGIFTIPHLIEFVLSEFDKVLTFCADDPEVAQLMLPIMTAYKQEAEGQIAGAISSSQLPVMKLNTKEIYWVLNPSEGEDFDLNITDPAKPIYFCVCNSPKIRTSLSAVISLVTAVCKNQMNQLGKHKSMFIVDELPTQYISNLDQLPAEARKKGVCTFLLLQSFKQLERAYGKDSAEITRDNCSNQFFFKTNSLPTAKHVSELYGEFRRAEESTSVSDHGGSKSVSTSLKRERILQPSDIRQQPPGHCTGFVATGDPSRFHTQFDFFEPDLLEIPRFSKSQETGDDAADSAHLMRLMEINQAYIKDQISNMLKEVIPLHEQEEAKSID